MVTFFDLAALGIIDPTPFNNCLAFNYMCDAIYLAYVIDRRLIVADVRSPFRAGVVKSLHI